MKKALFILLTTLSIIGFCSCSNSESIVSSKAEGCTPEDCLVYTLYSQAGIGDFGYQDLIYYGMNLAKESYHFSLENVHPSSMKSAESYIGTFFDETDSDKYRQRLLVLTSGEFDTLFTIHPEWKQDSRNTILVLGRRENSIDAHFWDISLYGASYLAGRTVKDMGLDSTMILAANPKTQAIQDAISGFIDGYRKSNGFFDVNRDILYLEDNEGEGFNSQMSYFYAAFDTTLSEKKFIFPVMGGSNLNLFRYMREVQDSLRILSCGMDANQENMSEGIAFSIEKKSDSLVMEFIKKWATGQPLETDFFATFDSKFVGVTVSKGYEEWAPHFKKFEDEAAEAERKYLEDK